MIKKIISCGDIHIRNLRRQEEYKQQLQLFIDKCKEIASQYEEDEVRIVVAGDILHNKIDISAEAYIFTVWFLRQLDKIAKTIVFAGNHDMNMSNLSRLDPLSMIFSSCNFKQVYYLDKELNYESGTLEDDNIVWCLYSSFDNFTPPCILDVRDYHFRSGIDDTNVRYVGLFHGELKSAKTDTGYASENGLSPEYFDGIDFGLLGHIHKRQCIKTNGVPLIYCGSLIQQDHGENISGHGFIVVDVETCEYESIDLPNEEYGFYTFTINSVDDIDNDLEEIINL